MPDFFNNYADFQVKVAGVVEARSTDNLHVIQKDNSHVLATVEVVYSTTSTKGVFVGLPNISHVLWKTNTPVSILYGLRPFINAAVFYGYVAGSTIIQKQEGDKKTPGFYKVQYLLTGTSQFMQVAHSRSFKNVTASYIATNLAKENGLRPVVTPHPFIFDYFVQDRKSDFRFLSDLADRIGYRFYVDGPDLFFVNPFIEYKRDNADTRPFFIMNRNYQTRDTLIDFAPVDGESVPDGGLAAIRKLSVINPTTNALVEATNQYLRFAAFNDPEGPNPIQTIEHRDYTASTYKEALALLAADTTANRHWVSATGTLAGDPRVAPGRLVDLVGTALYGPYQGSWMVREAEHHIHRDLTYPQRSTYRIDVTVGRDQIQNATALIPPEWDKVYAEVHAVQTDGRWRASNYGGSA